MMPLITQFFLENSQKVPQLPMTFTQLDLEWSEEVLTFFRVIISIEQFFTTFTEVYLVYKFTTH